MLEKFLHERRTGSADLDIELKKILGIKDVVEDLEKKSKSLTVVIPDLGTVAEMQYELYKPKPKEEKSIYRVITSMYDYVSKKAKNAYNTLSSKVKAKAKKIVLKTDNALRVLLRGFVRIYSVSKGSGNMNSRTPYGKPHDPTREDFFYEMMAVHYS